MVTAGCTAVWDRRHRSSGVSQRPCRIYLQSSAVRWLPFLVGSLILAGCSSAATSKPGYCSPEAKRTPCSSARTGVEYPMSLWTHCGVGYAYFAGRYWVIEPTQPEGANSLSGVMTLITADLAEFSSEGRRYDFKPASTSFSPPPCA